MSTPAQMYDHRLNAVKSWPSQYALDKSKEVAAGEEGIVAGKVIHIDPVANAFKLGLPANYMPIFAWVSQDAFDAVGGDDFNISNYGNKKGVSGLVATGAFELQTTEFVTGETYNPNTPLTSHEVAGADKGKVTPGTFYSDVICGIVSDGQETNANGADVVTFWSYFLPTTP